MATAMVGVAALMAMGTATAAGTRATMMATTAAAAT